MEVSFDTESAVLFNNNVITIKTGGTYVISGNLDNGQIVVDAEDKSTVKIVLNGVEIHSSDSAAINVVNAEKTIISLEKGTENVISDGDEYVFADSPTGEPNAAIFSKDDLDGSFDMRGGFLIAVGSSGMAQAVSDGSTQFSIMMSYPETQTTGTMVHLEDSEGKSVVSFVPVKDYQSVFISSPQFTKDSSYMLYSGGTSNGYEADGLYTDGDYQDGTKIVEFTISDSVTWLNESGITTARSSGPGGNGNQGRPEMGNKGDVFADLDEETQEKAQKNNKEKE